MDRMRRSNEIFAAAQARHPGSCLPGGATSPADRLGTVVVSHELIAALDRAARLDAQVRDLAAGSPSLERSAIGQIVDKSA